MIAKTVIATTALSAGLIGLIPTPAQADVERRVNCSAASRFDIDVDRTRSQFEIDVEVITDAGGETWRLVATQNGKQIHASTRTTVRDGDDRYADADWIFTRPLTGQSQRFTFRAKNATSGEVCRITVRA